MEGRPYAGVGRPANDFVMWKALCDFVLDY